MIRHRLYLQIYAAFLGIVILTGLLAAAIGRFVDGPDELPPPVRSAMAMLAERIPEDDPGPTVDALARRLGVDLTLFDTHGRPGAHHGRPVPPPDPDGPRTQWRLRRGGPSFVSRMDDGRWIGVGHPWRPGNHTRFIAAFSVLFAVAALVTWPLARAITRRLEALQSAMDAWGRGDLGTRAVVGGADEVARLATSFNAAADQVAGLVDGQRRMLASASHELRSPLARLRMALELMEGDEALRSAATRDIEELDTLVGDLLVASRAQAQGRVREPVEVDLGALVAEEAARVGAEASGSGVVQGDPALLRRMVRNLLENAGKYGAPPVRATVDGPTLVVEDAGAGVPEAERERIWEPFYRPAGHRESEGGVGLGLALVREIARFHGGTAVLEGGSRFVVRVG